MTRENLQRASQHLESAADATEGEAATRLADIAEDVGDLAESDRGPDHGRMARWQSALGEIRESVADDAAADIEAASDAISAYRETVDGV